MRKKLLSKVLLLLTLVFAGAGSAWADEVTKTINAIVSENNYTVSAGSDIGTICKSFNLNGNIEISTSGEANCGTFWGTSSIDWRLYQNNGGDVTVTAKNGYTLNSVTFTYTVSNNGTLKDGETTVESGKKQALEGSTKTFTVENTENKTNGQVKITQISVEYTSSSDTRTATTLTISAPEGFNKDIAKGETAGKLIATVSADTYELTNATVTWESETEDVVSIDEEGIVTLQDVGEAVIKATYGGDETYKGSSKTYKFTVVNSDQPGMKADNPYTVAQARAAIDAGTGVTDVYVKGIVSKIVTAYSSQHGNISYNISEDGTEEADQLQAYRGFSYNGEWFTSADDIQVGDEVVVFGNLTKYNNSTYQFSAGNKLVSLNRVAPYIIADNVEIEYNATSGRIVYTIGNPTDGSVSASTSAEWLTLSSDFISPIAFTCEANNEAAPREATITLTYTYGGENATKEVKVTQAGNPNLINNISDISEVGAIYKVRGTIVATNSRGFIIGDGTDYVYYYKNGTPTQAVGDKVEILGTTGTYGQIIQFTNTATVTEAESSNYNGTPAVAEVTEVPDYTSGYHLSTYFQFEGELSVNGSNYLIALGESQIQISYPNVAQTAELNALNGKKVLVKGYFSGINSNSKFTVMLESVEEVVSTEPVVNAEDVTLDYDATSGVIEYTIDNADATYGPTVSTTANWISAIEVKVDKITFTTTANDGDADRVATVTITYGEVKKEVTVTQKHYVVDYATLPFAFNGVRADIESTAGLAHSGLGSDYAVGNPRLKFDGTGDYVILKINEAPSALAFDVKGNGFSGGTFTVQVSADGESYTDLATYTELGATQTEVLMLNSDVRYIKWIYTEKSSGNVGMGNIKVVNSYQATIGAAGYATFVTAWPVDFSQSNVTAYVVSAVNEASVSLTEVTKVPVNAPVILKGAAGNYDLTIVEKAEAIESNKLLASDGFVTGNGSIYALGLDKSIATHAVYGFCKVKTGEAVPAGKAYLKIGTGTSEVEGGTNPIPGVRDFLAFAFGETDGIQGLRETTEDGAVYNLAGQCVQKAQRGIYVKNGRKVVVK